MKVFALKTESEANTTKELSVTKKDKKTGMTREQRLEKVQASMNQMEARANRSPDTQIVRIVTPADQKKKLKADKKLQYALRHAKDRGVLAKQALSSTSADPRKIAMEKIDRQNKIDVSNVTATDLMLREAGSQKNHYYRRGGKKFSRPLKVKLELPTSQVESSKEIVELPQDTVVVVAKPVRKPRVKKVADVPVEI